MGVHRLIESDFTLGTLTWPEAGERNNSLLAVPIGSTEQHGPHLPLDTDARIAAALASALAHRRSDVIVAPVIAYGASEEHAGFPGTLSIGATVLERLIVELVRSAAHTFSGVVLISGHGGNCEPVHRAVDSLCGEGHRAMAWFPRYSDGDAHAGRIETSIMLALAPHLVKLELAAAGNTMPLLDLIHLLRRDGVRAHSENGVIGDPTGASALEGQLILRRLSEDLYSAVEAKFGPS